MLVGLAFNTKMLAAMIVVPGLALAYLLFTRSVADECSGTSLAAGAVLVAVSGAWIAAVDLTDPAGRGRTSDRRATTARSSLAFDYNGLGRVSGQTGGTSFGGGLGGAFSGAPGFFRLINTALGDQGGWLLPLAIVGGLSLLVAAINGSQDIDLDVQEFVEFLLIHRRSSRKVNDQRPEDDNLG